MNTCIAQLPSGRHVQYDPILFLQYTTTCAALSVCDLSVFTAELLILLKPLTKQITTKVTGPGLVNTTTMTSPDTRTKHNHLC